MAGLFPSDSVIRRVSAEPALLLGAGRALLLQLAHPVVAQGVADHSDFRSYPFKRLQGTLEAMYAIVFGSEELALGVARRVRRIHGRVTGTSYRANDPPNLLWVHTTLVDTALRCYTTFVGPLTPVDEETYYQEMTRVAEALGCPRAAQPADVGEFRGYVRHMVSSLRVSDVGRDLACEIVRPSLVPPLGLVLGPLVTLHRLFAVGTTPEPLREQFGLEWTERSARQLEQAEGVLREILRLAPRPVRTAPGSLHGRLLLQQARRHVLDAGGEAAPGHDHP
jgi:uncharacterized protein (DUF2236 family)